MTKDELQKAVDDVITDCIRNDYAFGNYAHRVTEAVWPVLEAAEKERDDFAQQLVQSEIGKREISEAHDALRVEVGKLKDLEVSRCVKINGYIVDNARLAEEVERLRASLEAAEKAVTEAYQRGYATGQEEIEKELAELRSSMKFRTSLIGRAEAERDALRAKVAEMEQQAPLDAGSDVFRSAFEAALKAGNWPATRQGDGYRSPSTQIAWRIAFSTVNRLKLYALPGAQGEEK